MKEPKVWVVFCPGTQYRTPPMTRLDAERRIVLLAEVGPCCHEHTIEPVDPVNQI